MHQSPRDPMQCNQSAKESGIRTMRRHSRVDGLPEMTSECNPQPEVAMKKNVTEVGKNERIQSMLASIS
jgi:hypothetical protein